MNYDRIACLTSVCFLLCDEKIILSLIDVPQYLSSASWHDFSFTLFYPLAMLINSELFVACLTFIGDRLERPANDKLK